MPIGIGSGLWAVVLPVEKTNQIENPSGEYGTIGCAGLDGGAVGTSSQYQVFGAWSFQITPAAGGTSGGLMGTWQAKLGSDYSISAYVRGPLLGTVMVAAGDTNGANIVGSVVGLTLSDRWQQFSFKYTSAANATHRMVIRKTGNDTIGATPIYADGLQVEFGSATTFISGDDGGGTWQGAAHNSQSLRSGQYRAGGSVVALADLGLQVDQMLGVGMPPVENSSQSYAVVDGAQFQRTRAGARHFTLTAKPLLGTSIFDYHLTRRTLIDVFKPDLVTPQQPTTFFYYGGPGTITTQAYYDKGLELGNMDGPIAENAAISFSAYDPYWYSPTQQGTTLAPRTAIGSMNFMARRSPLGKWGSVGVNGGPNDYVTSLRLAPTGTIFAGGTFTTLDGTVGAKFLGMYNPVTNRWGTLIGGTASDLISVLEYNPAGTLFYGGAFTTIAGTVGAKNMGLWNGAAMGTLRGGTVDGQVRALAYTPTGSLIIGGVYTTTAGTTSGPIAVWTGAAFGTLPGGSLSNPTGPNVFALLYASDRSLYATGSFNKAAGSTANHVARYANGSWGTMSGGFGQQVAVTDTQGYSLAQGPSGVVYIGGVFGTIGGVVGSGIAQWNGVTLTALGGGIGSSGALSLVQSIIANQQNGNVLALGYTFGGSAGGIPIPDDQAIWTGGAWIPLDIDLAPGPSLIRAGVYDQYGALYLAGSFPGTAQAASVGTIVNTGRAAVYPTLRLRNLGAGTGRIYQLANTLTGNAIYFNYSMLPNEQLTLNLQPGSRSFQSTSFGNVFNAILPASNLATLNLLSGINYVSFFSDNDSIEAAFFWTPRSWSADGGTVG